MPPREEEDGCFSAIRAETRPHPADVESDNVAAVDKANFSAVSHPKESDGEKTIQDDEVPSLGYLFQYLLCMIVNFVLHLLGLNWVLGCFGLALKPLEDLGAVEMRVQEFNDKKRKFGPPLEKMENVNQNGDNKRPKFCDSEEEFEGDSEGIIVTEEVKSTEKLGADEKAKAIAEFQSRLWNTKPNLNFSGAIGQQESSTVGLVEPNISVFDDPKPVASENLQERKELLKFITPTDSFDEVLNMSDDQSDTPLVGEEVNDCCVVGEEEPRLSKCEKSVEDDNSCVKDTSYDILNNSKDKGTDKETMAEESNDKDTMAEESNDKDKETMAEESNDEVIYLTNDQMQMEDELKCDEISNNVKKPMSQVMTEYIESDIEMANEPTINVVQDESQDEVATCVSDGLMEEDKDELKCDEENELIFSSVGEKSQSRDEGVTYVRDDQMEEEDELKCDEVMEDDEQVAVSAVNDGELNFCFSAEANHQQLVEENTVESVSEGNGNVREEFLTNDEVKAEVVIDEVINVEVCNTSGDEDKVAPCNKPSHSVEERELGESETGRMSEKAQKEILESSTETDTRGEESEDEGMYLSNDQKEEELQLDGKKQVMTRCIDSDVEMENESPLSAVEDISQSQVEVVSDVPMKENEYELKCDQVKENESTITAVDEESQSQVESVEKEIELGEQESGHMLDKAQEEILNVSEDFESALIDIKDKIKEVEGMVSEDLEEYSEEQMSLKEKLSLDFQLDMGLTIDEIVDDQINIDTEENKIELDALVHGVDEGNGGKFGGQEVTATAFGFQSVEERVAEAGDDRTDAMMQDVFEDNYNPIDDMLDCDQPRSSKIPDASALAVEVNDDNPDDKVLAESEGEAKSNVGGRRGSAGSKGKWGQKSGGKKKKKKFL